MSSPLTKFSIAAASIAASLAAGCANVEQIAVIHDADLEFRAQHEQKIAKFEAAGSADHLSFDDRRFVLTGHHVVRGDGDVLTIRREDSGSLWKTDQASFRYLTIYFPKGQFQTDIPIRFGRPSGPIAFFSRGSLNMPGTNGCFGYALQGHVTLHKLGHRQMGADLDLPFTLASPLGFQGECGAEAIRTMVEARELGLTELKQGSQ